LTVFVIRDGGIGEISGTAYAGIAVQDTEILNIGLGAARVAAALPGQRSGG